MGDVFFVFFVIKKNPFSQKAAAFNFCLMLHCISSRGQENEFAAWSSLCISWALSYNFLYSLKPIPRQEMLKIAGAVWSSLLVLPVSRMPHSQNGPMLLKSISLTLHYAFRPSEEIKRSWLGLKVSDNKRRWNRCKWFSTWFMDTPARSLFCLQEAYRVGKAGGGTLRCDWLLCCTSFLTLTPYASYPANS